MKKVGVLNFHYSNHNYGAVLQAAAIVNIIKNLGYDAECIDYIPEMKKKIDWKQKLRDGIIRFLDVIKLKKHINIILGKKNIISYHVSNEYVFEDFRSQWLKRTQSSFNSHDDLKKISDDYYAVVVGSDQVWRPSQYNNKDDVFVYFLEFISKKTKKISYAASFGVDNWEFENDDKLTNQVKNSIKSFSSVSVREKSGIGICTSIFSVSSCHVLDPTLLVGKEFFNLIIGESVLNSSQNNIVYYKLDADLIFINDINKLGVKLNKEVENIYHKKVCNEYEYYTVKDWLMKIRNSDLVITDSFHCVCFSLLFEKDFICCINPSRGLSRLESLLNSLGLTDRIYYEDIGLSEFLSNIKPIDYKRVNDILEEHRIASMDYLFTALRSD